MVPTVMHCSRLCLMEGPHCKSINFDTTAPVNGKCELNNNVSASNPLNLLPDRRFNYFERDEVSFRNNKLHCKCGFVFYQYCSK